MAKGKRKLVDKIRDEARQRQDAKERHECAEDKRIRAEEKRTARDRADQCIAVAKAEVRENVGLHGSITVGQFRSIVDPAIELVKQWAEGEGFDDARVEFQPAYVPSGDDYGPGIPAHYRLQLLW